MRERRRSFASSLTLSSLLALCGRLVQERIARDLEPLGVSYAQAAALICLWRRDGQLPQAEMIESLALSRTSGSIVLNDLEQRGLIERRPVHRDARRLVVRLTEAGVDLEPPVFEVFQHSEDAIRASLTDEEAEAGLGMLRAVLDGIQHDRRR